MQQHRVGPMGSSPKGQGGARKEVSQWGGDHGPLMERDFPGRPPSAGPAGVWRRRTRSPSTSFLELDHWTCSSRARGPKRGCAVSQVR